MGYFPNGTAGEMYEGYYCSRCVHQHGPDGESGCAVWHAHLLHSYADCNNKDSILHILIPREGIENEQCRMFHEKQPEPERVQLVDLMRGERGTK